MKASRMSGHRPTCSSVSFASSPGSPYVSGTTFAVLTILPLRHTHGDRLRLHLGLDMGRRVALASVEFVEQRVTRPDIERSPGRHADERRSRRVSDEGARDGSQPSEAAVGGDHADVEDTVVGPCIWERADPTDDLSK